MGSDRGGAGVCHWTRDAAVVAFELSAAYAAGTLPGNQPLIDYVGFSRLCQAAPGDFDRASYYISGTQRPWTDQSDGPALQTLALLALIRGLDPASRQVALALIDANLNFLATAYTGQAYNLWEEKYGASFFARSVQLKCFQAIAANKAGIPVPGWLPAAVSWLTNALDQHWNGEFFQSVLPSVNGYDPNIDVVMAAVYGAEQVTDTRLLAHAARLRAQWAEPGAYFYPINGYDAQRGIGPLLGRYPGDVYDGDTDAQIGDHPWALTTANFAESVRNLLWSYAAFLSAVRARGAPG